MDEQLADRACRAAAEYRLLLATGRDQGLEPAEWSVLLHLAIHTEAANQALQDELALKPGTLTNALGVLRARGLVTTAPDTSNVRRRVHRLSRKGHDIAQSLVRDFAKDLESRDTGIPDEGAPG